MKRTIFRKSSAYARGSVAIEAAIVIPIFLVVFAGLLFLGRVFWHYSVAQKAAHDAARFLATTSLREIKATSSGGEIPIALIAAKIAQEEVSELNPGGGVFITISCYVGETNPYWDRCYGVDVPKKVMARVTVNMTDPFLDTFTSAFTDGQPIVLRAAMATDYAGE